MKRIALLLILVLILPAWADDTPPAQLIITNSGKAVTFPETISADGHYAVGWTLRPHHKNAKPIDWSTWDASDQSKFINAYAGYLPDLISDKDDYELVNCLIDLKAKQLLLLPAEDPVYPGASHSDLTPAWGPVGQGKRYVVIENSMEATVENLWLVTIDSSGMHPIDVSKSAEDAAAKLIAEYRPMVHHAYEVRYILDPNEDVQGKRKVVYTDSTVALPFDSDAYKNEVDNSGLQGTLTLKLSDGSIVKVESADPRDDPFKDLPELVKADHELNQIYGQLSQKLSPAKRADLKAEQLDWIQKRDYDADAAYSSVDSRNKSLVDSTQKRVRDLQDRLNALH